MHSSDNWKAWIVWLLEDFYVIDDSMARYMNELQCNQVSQAINPTKQACMWPNGKQADRKLIAMKECSTGLDWQNDYDMAHNGGYVRGLHERIMVLVVVFQIWRERMLGMVYALVRSEWGTDVDQLVPTDFARVDDII